MEDTTCRELVENASDIVYAHDLDGRFTWVNRACERITGYCRDEVLRMRIWDLVAPEYRAALEKNLSGDMQTFEVEIVTREGRRVPLELKSRLVHRGHMPVGVQGIARDVTERQKTAQALRESEERYALAAQGSNDGLWDWDLRKNRIFFSARWKEQLGIAEGEIGGAPDEWFDRVHPDDRARLRSDSAQHLEGRTPTSRDRVPRPPHGRRAGAGCWCAGAAVRDASGKAYRLAGSQTDITDRKSAEEKLLHDALHDALTGLPNRSLFLDRLSQAMACSQRRAATTGSRCSSSTSTASRRSTTASATRGATGCSSQVARRLRRAARGPETRWRGWAATSSPCCSKTTPTPTSRCATADRVQEALAAAYDLDGTEVFVSASIGVAAGSPSYATPEEILRDADTAMYRAKDLGRARHAVFQPAMHAHARARLQLETDLRRGAGARRAAAALPAHRLLVLGADHRVRGADRLGPPHPRHHSAQRLHPQRRGDRPHRPHRELGALAACADARAWNDAIPRGQPGVSVSVNLSARQLLRPELLDEVRTALAESGLPAPRLRLEVTESVIMEHAGPAAVLLAQLKAMSVHLLLDDFGTGYSSLSYLHNFRFDTLKIDRSFVMRIEQSSKQAEIVRTIVSLAHALSMEVIAEGVENPAQVQQLQTLHVQSAQGYWFSRPVAARAFHDLLLLRKTYALPLSPSVHLAH